MSADNGYIIRKNKRGKFVLQMYFASWDEYPELPENPAKAAMFDTLEDAVRFYNDRSLGFNCEYGLTVDVPKECEVKNLNFFGKPTPQPPTKSELNKLSDEELETLYSETRNVFEAEMESRVGNIVDPSNQIGGKR